MKKWHKIGIGIALAALIGGVAWYSIYQANKDVVTVQTGQVIRRDLTSLVTASGEIRPKNYTNVLGEGIGKITEIHVKEGDHVRKGDVLLRLENVQPGADVQAQMASIDAGNSAMKMSGANYDASVATVAQRESDLNKAKLDWGRSLQLFDEKLISKQDYDASKSVYDGAVAALNAARAQLSANEAARDQARFNLQQAQAVLMHQRDVLNKTTYTAPIDGVVSYIAVRVGENVVPGIQNATGSFLLTISDMSIVTSEVKVDETDIATVKNGQPADVTIDAFPDRVFKGHVSEVGQLAILRTSGQAAMTETTANTQEARDFKVVITLDDPPGLVRPGLTSTAKIQIAQKTNVLTIPIQALAERTQKELQDASSGNVSGVTLAAAKDSEGGPKKLTGVFASRNGKAAFIPVQTGITGVTDIEVTDGLHEGDSIITGSYKALRTLKPGAPVKIDNTPPHENTPTT
jgi:HlyD family secretion protein